MIIQSNSNCHQRSFSKLNLQAMTIIEQSLISISFKCFLPVGRSRKSEIFLKPDRKLGMCKIANMYPAECA